MKYLSSLAEATIEDLQAEGFALSPVEIVRINALAHRIETPGTRLALSRGTPVKVGGVYLWPMTLAGSDWFQRIGGKMHRQKLQTYALAYAMANGREILPQDPQDAERAVNEWRAELTCRYSELIEAIQIVHEQWDQIDTGEKSAKATPGDLAMMLAAMTGTAPEVWEYQCSIQYSVTLLERLVAQNNADGQSNRDDPRIKAERAFGLYLEKLRKQKLAGKQNG